MYHVNVKNNSIIIFLFHVASQIPGQGNSVNVKYQVIHDKKLLTRNEWHLQFGFLLAIFGVIN